MLSLALSLSTLLFALSAAASPIVEARSPIASLPFALKLNVSGSTIADIDRARAAHLISAGRERAAARAAGRPYKRADSITVTNVATTYVASVGIGSPATTYSLLIDTGSSNTWVGAGKKYVKTSTSVSTGKSVSVTYGSGSFSGTEYTDTVSLGSGLTVTAQSIGVASRSSGFSGVDGILGIGPTDLTEDTVSGVSTVPTVTDNLASQGVISPEVVGISYNPTTSDSVANGELTFGGTDSSKYTGSITYVSITSTSPADEYWGINESITYGSATGTTVLSSSAGIVDTGTTLVLLGTTAYDKYVSLTGATLDETTGLLKISSTNYAKLESLSFNIGGTSFLLTANGQTWPRALNTAIGGSSSSIYLIVGDLGDIAAGLEFINGYTFLERFYSVFDTTNKRVGFATTANTDATSN